MPARVSPKAVIFDMDGVILDSMPYHVRAWQETFCPLGLKITSFEVYRREGESWRKSTRDFLLMAGLKPSTFMVEEVFKKRSEIFGRIFKPKIFPGVGRLLAWLKKNDIVLGLVTATPRRDVMRILPGRILEQFDVTICGDDTKKGKPHPEPYLKALKRLRLRPKEALVIENAPYGIRSCKLAGIACIALSTSLPQRYLKGADYTVSSLGHLRKLLNNRLSYYKNS